MTWVVIAARKMALKNRINSMESQLLKIEQQIQDAYDDSSYDQQMDQMAYDEGLAYAQDAYNTRANIIDKLYKNRKKQGGVTTASNGNTRQYMRTKRFLDKTLNRRNQCRQDKVDAKTRALEAQKEKLETQLESARTEYDSLQKACSTDIQKGAPKLGIQG